MKFNKMKKPFAIMLTLALLIGTATGCADNTANSKSVAIQTENASTKATESVLRLSGVLLPVQTVTVSSSTNGTVKSVNVEAGTAVKAGDVLAQIDTDLLSAQLGQAEAGVSAAKAAYSSVQNQLAMAKINYEKAEKDYSDVKVLHASGAVSDSQLSNAKQGYDLAKKQYESLSTAQLDQASAAIQTASASVDTLQIQKNKAEIVSPIDGVILSTELTEGELANPGTKMFTIANLSELKMIDTVSQGELPYLQVGQKVALGVDIYPDKTYEGQVTTIGPMSASTGQLFPVEIKFENKDELFAGLTASAELSLTSGSHIAVPAEAVMGTEAAPYVFVIEEGLAHKRQVVTGLRGTDTIEILNGLSEGEPVAISNTHILQDMMPVQVMN